MTRSPGRRWRRPRGRWRWSGCLGHLQLLWEREQCIGEAMRQERGGTLRWLAERQRETGQAPRRPALQTGSFAPQPREPLACLSFAWKRSSSADRPFFRFWSELRRGGWEERARELKERGRGSSGRHTNRAEPPGGCGRKRECERSTAAPLNRNSGKPSTQAPGVRWPGPGGCK